VNSAPAYQQTVRIDASPETVFDLFASFVHSGLPESAVESHGDGWRHYLEQLAVATTGEPGPGPWVNTATEGT
jgi:hypothetical protein